MSERTHVQTSFGHANKISILKLVKVAYLGYEILILTKYGFNVYEEYSKIGEVLILSP